ncbi:MAG: hypothetical protein LBD02_03905 [Christensenellaceae bacterium]|jgi:hypothetical protein|nr:hypothetical protein [Christensenellaceae bacterium]
MKKGLALCLAVLLLVAMAPLAFADTFGDFEAVSDGAGGWKITGYTGSGGLVVIPDELDGLPVTEIADLAFYRSSPQVTANLVIPESVRVIGERAFDASDASGVPGGGLVFLSVTFLQPDPTLITIGKDIFSYAWNLPSFRVYVPSGSQAAYEAVNDGGGWQGNLGTATGRIVDGFPVVLTVTRNGEPWPDHGLDLSFVANTAAPIPPASAASLGTAGNSSYFAVGRGAYYIFANGKDTGATITIQYGEGRATVNFVAFGIMASAGAGGSVSPDGEVLVWTGENKIVRFAPDAGYSVGKIIVDGVELSGAGFSAAVAAGAYTFENVTGAHTIQVTFKQDGGSGNPLPPPPWTEEQPTLTSETAAQPISPHPVYYSHTVPQTGDRADLALWALVLGAAILGAGGVFWAARRRPQG